MELSYAITNTDGGIIAFVVSFISIIFLGCLSFTIFIWRRIGLPQEKFKPSEKLTISYWEERFLGAHFGTEPNLAARFRALRAHQRRNQRIS
ncbi:hypothetical protein ACFL4C_04615, partial [Candidatus Omnitrophota bacterium]